MSSYGVRSMTAPLHRAALRVPATTGDFTAAGWPEEPDPTLLLAEHLAYAEVLRGLGVEVEMLEAMSDAVDATFAYDPVFVTGSGVIVLRPIKPVRTGEPPVLARELEALGLPIIGALSGSAHADGGDLMWLDEETLALGRGYRTNAEAHRQITEVVAAEGVRTVSFDLPHAGGRSEVLHLMSVVSLVNDQVAVVYEPLTPVALMEALEGRGIHRIPVSAEEYDLLGSNVLAVDPDHAVIFAGAPAVVAGLEEAGVEVTVVRADQIALGTGGPTCLTRPPPRG